MEKLLTHKEVAEILQVKPATIYKWVAERRIPFLLINQGQRKACVRFRNSDIEKWLMKKVIPVGGSKNL